MRYLIATHGTLAQGFANTLTLLAGIENVDVICAYSCMGTAIEQQFEEKIKDYNDQEPIVVFTDIFGGSVTQVAVKMLKGFNAHVIAGVNLALILEMILMRTPAETEAIQQIVNQAKEQIVYVNAFIES